ncbi:MAG: DUF3883 domain-containing protein [Actinomycetota bacterium]|nr:DUF3883 domain-containing protein [Actinomycetota bacterium]MDZ4178338.1 DUF3883 domain-containing protein [Coriobacteriia bacterium]
MPQPRLSTGRLQIVLPILARAQEYPGASITSLSKMMAGSGDMGGAVPWADSLDIAMSAGLLDAGQSGVRLTDAGSRVVNLRRSGDSRASLHEALREYVLNGRRDLLTLVFMTDAEIDAFVDSDTRQCLRDLELLPKNGTIRSRQWWAGLLDQTGAVDEQTLKELGDWAESTSIQYEKRRLADEGFTSLAASVEWVSREDEGLGYDILSYVGANCLDLDPETRLRVEVKAMGLRREAFRFYLTRNEWQVAQSSPDRYLFHLWRLVDLVNPADASPTMVRDPDSILALLPQDVCSSGRWTECEVVLR